MVPAAAGVMSFLIYAGMNLGGGEISYVFPWGSMIISVLGVFSVVFITVVYAVGKIRKENIIDALSDNLA